MFLDTSDSLPPLTPMASTGEEQSPAVLVTANLDPQKTQNRLSGGRVNPLRHGSGQSVVSQPSSGRGNPAVSSLVHWSALLSMLAVVVVTLSCYRHFYPHTGPQRRIRRLANWGGSWGHGRSAINGIRWSHGPDDDPELSAVLEMCLDMEEENSGLLTLHSTFLPQYPGENLARQRVAPATYLTPEVRTEEAATYFTPDMQAEQLFHDIAMTGPSHLSTLGESFQHSQLLPTYMQQSGWLTETSQLHKSHQFGQQSEADQLYGLDDLKGSIELSRNNEVKRPDQLSERIQLQLLYDLSEPSDLYEPMDLNTANKPTYMHNEENQNQLRGWSTPNHFQHFSQLSHSGQGNGPIQQEQISSPIQLTPHSQLQPPRPTVQPGQPNHMYQNSLKGEPNGYPPHFSDSTLQSQEEEPPSKRLKTSQLRDPSYLNHHGQDRHCDQPRQPLSHRQEHEQREPEHLGQLGCFNQQEGPCQTPQASPLEQPNLLHSQSPASQPGQPTQRSMTEDSEQPISLVQKSPSAQMQQPLNLSRTVHAHHTDQPKGAHCLSRPSQPSPSTQGHQQSQLQCSDERSYSDQQKEFIQVQQASPLVQPNHLHSPSQASRSGQPTPHKETNETYQPTSPMRASLSIQAQQPYHSRAPGEDQRPHVPTQPGPLTEVQCPSKLSYPCLPSNPLDQEQPNEAHSPSRLIRSTDFSNSLLPSASLEGSFLALLQHSPVDVEAEDFDVTTWLNPGKNRFKLSVGESGSPSPVPSHCPATGSEPETFCSSKYSEVPSVDDPEQALRNVLVVSTSSVDPVATNNTQKDSPEEAETQSKRKPRTRARKKRWQFHEYQYSGPSVKGVQRRRRQNSSQKSRACVPVALPVKEKVSETPPRKGSGSEETLEQEPKEKEKQSKDKENEDGDVLTRCSSVQYVVVGPPETRGTQPDSAASQPTEERPSRPAPAESDPAGGSTFFGFDYLEEQEDEEDDFLRNHPFFRLPRLQPGVKVQQFCVTSAFAFPNMIRHPSQTLGYMRTALAGDTLGESEANGVVLAAQRAVSHLLHFHQEEVPEKRVANAVFVLANRFLILDSLLCAIEVLGPAMVPHLWWDDLSRAIPSDVDPQHFQHHNETGWHLQELALRLSTAVTKLKKGHRLRPKETVNLKRELFCDELSPAAFRKRKWNSWRTDDDAFMRHALPAFCKQNKSTCP
ncbi:WGS project CABT00000000 data, contig 2.18, related [Eimeria necatrix]|uniref:WGS project CABT00000000 data, contig 2.18, related n=1 Tax=Eimeria necatrix TaxID=51315 RepID=U6MK11_9EIME|nr:WGS project CABT00000000 data, contig 2.18, related [Eimeria necatrix]CDJ64542.1 WGS project CABT00000000 data, contig 2.18, related [Eimeria necatrix]